MNSTQLPFVNVVLCISLFSSKVSMCWRGHFTLSLVLKSTRPKCALMVIFVPGGQFVSTTRHITPFEFTASE